MFVIKVVFVLQIFVFQVVHEYQRVLFQEELHGHVGLLHHVLFGEVDLLDV